jgi:cytochrome c
MLKAWMMGCSLSLLVAGTAAAQGDPAAGEKVFAKCKACHVLDTSTNRIGPHLGDVIGRTAGSVEGFKYSDAMKAKGEEGLVWNDETIAAYLADPKGYIPKNKMAFPGLKKEEDVANVIAYLHQAAGSATN